MPRSPLRGTSTPRLKAVIGSPHSRSLPSTIILAGPIGRMPKRWRMATERLAVSLFAAVDRPAIEPKTVTLDELACLLTTFEVLPDKYAARCWSPARYRD